MRHALVRSRSSGLWYCAVTMTWTIGGDTLALMIFIRSAVIGSSNDVCTRWEPLARGTPGVHSAQYCALPGRRGSLALSTVWEAKIEQIRRKPMALRRNLLRRVADIGGFGESSTGLGMKKDLVGEESRVRMNVSAKVGSQTPWGASLDRWFDTKAT
ncbi:hypothetical protein B0H14DRAFT_2736960 [Mycena olivaceomarginata]|nr:hypothetical protein B0H14DRAFT_2736960 [Mycena olivaceomarginata]